MKKKIRYDVLLWIIFLIAFQVCNYTITQLFIREPILIGSELDSKIPFLSEFIYFYVIWYPMLIIVPYILHLCNKQKFYKYSVSVIMCALIGSVIFLIFPTTVERAVISGTSISEKIISLIYQADARALNCFPSFHCILSLLFILSVYKDKKIPIICRVAIEILSIFIILSTLFIKQHVIYDFIGALIISVVTWYICNKYKLHLHLRKFLGKVKRKIVR